jgi:ferredoxin-NADP reductase
METYPVKILSAEPVTHNVKRFKVEKPAGYTYIPGQATELSLDAPEWKNERRPFTFTSLTTWDHLEFTIKIYTDHPGVTNQLGQAKAGDTLLLHDVFGAIQYYGEGTFIAGGAGVTPFIAILRQLQQEKKLGQNKLLFSNNTEKDIILKAEFSAMLGKNFINTLTQEKTSAYDNRKIDKAYLSEKIIDLKQYFYLCGPDPMVEAIQHDLISLGVDQKMVIIEQF